MLIRTRTTAEGTIQDDGGNDALLHDYFHAKPPEEAAKTDPIIAFDFRIVTYNTLSAKAEVQKQLLDHHFHKHAVGLIGIQEARPERPGRSQTEHYHVVSSPGEDGTLGCQIWLHKSLQLAHGHQENTWQARSIAIVCSEPRMLAIIVKISGQKFYIVSGHSPHGASGTDAIRRFWQNLDRVLRQAPNSCLPIVLLNANARFQSWAEEPCSQAAQGMAAECMCKLAEEHELAVSGLKDTQHRPIVTWTSPQGKDTCLDYVLLPGVLRSGFFTLGEIPEFWDLHDRDHAPLLVQLRWAKPVREDRTCKVRYDVQAMRTPEGKAKLRQIHNNTPSVPWQVHVDDHEKILVQHLQQSLQEHFPVAQDKPRQPYISDKTWQLVRERRAWRRIQRRAKDRLNAEILHACFGQWRQNRDNAAEASQRRQKSLRMLVARCTKGIWTSTKTYKAAAKQDSAEYVRQAFADARREGAEALHRLLRGVMKTGRRYRAPPVAPAIVMPDGVVAEDACLELGKHFAADERGDVCTDLEQLRTITCAAPVELQASGLPTFAQVSKAFSAMKTRKAPGPSGIPSEALSGAARQAANQYVPLVIKMAMRAQCPLLWRGGCAAAIPKPQKAPSSFAGWRSILLQEAAAKGVAKATRNMLI